ncbi:TniQ family protein [Bacillus suaedaesalsae]|uniref:TniQ family protein n=1 Tax=Bacillus suaedaesalsae TaxID=2810349 RepID=A0ABS2DCK7_9BACI|nr:TniQ family protein [Bacillus suaedaesalsae]
MLFILVKISSNKRVFGGIYINTFTIRIKPQPNESLLSYLVRLSNANGTTLHRLINSLSWNTNKYFQDEMKILIDYSPYSHP